MRKRTGLCRTCLWIFSVSLFATVFASATTFKKEATIVDLLKQSELILRGRITKVTDGVDTRGIPYTEVTLQVAETIKGQAKGTYTFRQFGLLKPRSMGDGHVNLMVTPAAWSTYTQGEETILFLNKPAAWTGLQTTTGLGQGKFKVSLGGVMNQVNNAGLFKSVDVDSTLLGDREKRIMSTKKGAVNAQGFVSLVKQAVDGKWVEKGRMRNANK